MFKNSEFCDEIQAKAKARYNDAEPDIFRTWMFFNQGNPLMAEKAVQRLSAASNRAELAIRDDAARMAPIGAEAVKGERSNFLPISFLAMGTSVSRAVARVNVQSTGMVGTGFICAPGLLITNNHVLNSVQAATSALVEFDFVEDDVIKPSVYKLDPARCFVTDDVLSLDFSIIALGDRVDGSEELTAFGWCPLSAASNKHAVGEFANIIQHPEGSEKQVVLQDNLIVSRGDGAAEEHDVLHYVADTEPGSSGSPVFNNTWQVIALHHWGEATKNLGAVRMFDPKSVNQGIRISRIVQHLQSQSHGLVGQEQRLITELLRLGETVLPKDVMALMESRSPLTNAGHANNYRTGPGGTTAQNVARWTIPLEISVSIPGLMANAHTGAVTDVRVKADTKDTSSSTGTSAEAQLPKTGDGYRPDFLDDHVIELPKMRASHRDLVLPLNEPTEHPSAKTGELQFTHFSILMHRDRKLPIFGACNVDGKTLFGINGDKLAYDYSDDDVKIFRTSAAEGGYGWRWDRRIDKEDQTIENWYTGKNDLVPRPGTDDAQKYKPIADFDRGHMVRRTEPIWGERKIGQAANYQTFTHVNAAPQTKKFNQSKQRDAAAIEAGEETRSWYGLEVAVLRAATDEDKKMNVFTGPIFENTDPVYGPGKEDGSDRQVPLSFWKIVVWEDGSDLKSLAMRYSQAWSVEVDTGAEALDDAGELFLLRDFLTTVDDVQDATGILFGQKVKNADVLKDVAPDILQALTPAEFQALLGQ